MGANFVAIENLDAMAAFAQLIGEEICERRFAGARHSGEPEGKALAHVR